MSLTRKVALNTAVQVIGKFIAIFLSFILVVFLTRYLGVSGYGQYTTIFAYLGFFSVFVDFGLYTIAVREMASRPNKMREIAGNLLGLRFILALFMFTAAILLAFLLPYSPAIKKGIIIGAFSIAFTVVAQASFSVFQTKLRMDFAAASEILGRVATLVLTLFFIFKNLSLYYIIGAYVLGNFLTFLIGYLFAQRFVKFYPLFDFKEWFYLIKESAPLGISTVLGALYFKVDTVLLSILPLQNNLSNVHEVGIYGVAYKVIEILLALPGMFIGSIFPILSYEWTVNKERVKELFQKGFDALLSVTLPMMFFLILLSPIVINIIGGKEFGNASKPLAILSVATAFSFLTSILPPIIIIAKKQKLMIYMSAIALLVNVGLNIIIIPRYSYIGAASVTLFGEITVFIMMLYITFKTTKIFPKFKNFSKILLATLVASGFLYFLMNNIFVVDLENGIVEKFFKFSVISLLSGSLYLVLLNRVGVLNREIIRKIIKRD